MFDNYNFGVKERLLRYVQIDTQSDPLSNSFPSTEKQKDLGRLLVEELHQIGINDAMIDEFGYVYASIPSNSDKTVPVICFCAHMDTAPDCSDIILPDDSSQIITVVEHPYLSERIGDDIITASGTTLLGADDKAGIAVIMDMAHYLISHPEVKHGTIRILFTPDEEVGRGVNKLDLSKLGAAVAYT